jgi:hypothetical protein
MSILTAALVLGLAPSAWAGANAICRCLGLGWSDGYHAHTNCPPPPAHGQRYWGGPGCQPGFGGAPSAIDYLPDPAPTPAGPQEQSRLRRPAPQPALQPAAGRPWIPSAERLR